MKRPRIGLRLSWLIASVALAAVVMSRTLGVREPKPKPNLQRGIIVALNEGHSVGGGYFWTIYDLAVPRQREDYEIRSTKLKSGGIAYLVGIPHGASPTSFDIIEVCGSPMPGEFDALGVPALTIGKLKLKVGERNEKGRVTTSGR